MPHARACARVRLHTQSTERTENRRRNYRMNERKQRKLYVIMSNNEMEERKEERKNKRVEITKQWSASPFAIFISLARLQMNSECDV